MAIIIDANCAASFENCLQDAPKEVLRRVSARKMKAVVGGLLFTEIVKTKMRRLLLEWARIGMIIHVDDIEVDRMTVHYSNLSLRSDDPHVLALASISGCRLLLTDDVELSRDFKSINLIRPKGKIIRSTSRIAVVRSMLNKHGN